MDKPNRPANPLSYPADEVLRAAVALENDPSFRVIASWIAACCAAQVHRLPSLKDDIDLRWTQGHCQMLLIINKTLTQPREELQNREAKAKEAALPRNI